MSLSILIIYIPLNITDNALPIVQTSICSQNLWLRVYLHSVDNFSNKRLKISSLQMSFNLKGQFLSCYTFLPFKKQFLSCP